MRVGNTLVINIDKLTPDFVNEWTSREEGEFNAEFVFNFELFQNQYIKIVKEEENKDRFGDEGNFFRLDKWNLCILATYESDEQYSKVLAGIPHSESMAVYKVQ